jgi:VWFA-related protein
MTASRLPHTALLALAMLSGTAFAQQPAAQQPAQNPQQPPVQIQVPPLQRRDPILTLHAESRAVLLDVVVTDGHGNPVHNLQPGDFRIIEDGETQTVASLEEHHPPDPAKIAAEPKLPALASNTFSNRKAPATDRSDKSAATVFLLDAVDSPMTAQIYARDQILQWIAIMPPGTEVAIFQLGVQLHLIQGFTSDSAVLRSAVKDRYKPLLTALPRRAGYVGQAFQMDSINSAMKSLGAYLATRPGRKNLIWFTGHVPPSVYANGSAMGGSLHDSESFVFNYSKATEALTLGDVSVYPIDTRGLQTDPAWSAANSGPPSNHSASNFAATQFFQHSDLQAVAEATGGRAFYNTNGIKQVISEVVDAGSTYYTLSYYPTNKQWDGRYRKLKLETTQPRLQLEYRRGYYALAVAPPSQPPATTTPLPSTSYPPDPYGRVQLTHHQPTPDQAAFIRAMHLGGIDPNQIVFTSRVEINPAVDKLGKKDPLPKDNFLDPKYKDHPFRTFNIFSQVDFRQIEVEEQPDGYRTGTIECAAFVLDDQGLIVNSLITSVDLHLSPASYAQALAGGVELLSPIAVPEKGTYFLRVGVHDKSTGRAGALEFSTSDVKIAPPTP